MTEHRPLGVAPEDWPLLFDLAPQQFKVGDQVVVQTMWGYERCVVLEKGRDRGHPIVTLRGKSGDTFTVSIGRVRGVVVDDT